MKIMINGDYLMEENTEQRNIMVIGFELAEQIIREFGLSKLEGVRRDKYNLYKVKYFFYPDPDIQTVVNQYIQKKREANAERYTNRNNG